MYLKKNYSLMWLIPLVLAIMIIGCEQRLGVVSPPSFTPPLVSSTNPANAAVGVAINQKVAATFSVEMDATTITSSTFTLMNGTTSVSGFVSYTGTTAIFDPTSNLVPNTAYTAMLTTGAKDFDANALASNYTWTFTTGASVVLTAPTLSSTVPANSATNVALNQKVAATFSTAMDATTITSSTFTLMNGTTPVSGFVSYTGTTALFAPAVNLASNTLYTATLTTGAKDLAGNALASNNVWHFTTGSTVVVTAPLVSSTDPANAAVGVALNQKIAATFSTAMDATTITGSTFTLKQGTDAIPSFVSYSGTTALLAPSSNLLPNTTYSVTLTTGAKDLAGNALATNYSWSFTTGLATVVTPPVVSATNPVDNATGVALNQQLAATFSKTMDATTITGATFTLMQNTTPVSGFVSYNGTTASFVPAGILAPNVEYTATITTGAKDLAGNALATNYVWHFTSGLAVVFTPPTVASTNPADAAVGVALNQNIAATFSTAMDASSITAATFTLNMGATSISGFVSYSGSTAIFEPAVNLEPSTEYSAKITNAVRNLAGNAMVADFTWSFTTGTAVIISQPTVSATIPLNAATGVALNQEVVAVFSRAMDPTTITAATFTLSAGTLPISGFVSYTGVTARLVPAGNLAPNTDYTATITTGVKDLAGNALAINYSWIFQTGSATTITRPTVSSTDPVASATEVILNQIIAATFSVDMDAATITSSTFTLRQAATPISGFVSYSGTAAFFAPASDLAPNTEYTATITTGAENLAGNGLAANYVWSFTTGAAAVITPPTVSSTDPADAAIGVILNKIVSATFSVTMDATTITSATFTLKQGTTPISGFVSYSNTTAFFAPASNLAPNTEYTAMITTGARDLAGNGLELNYSWSFTTGTTAADAPPEVMLTDPADLEECVALDKQITVTFSEAMRAGTITTATFTIMKMNGATFISGTVSYIGVTATFVPLSDLELSSTYIATITTGVMDVAGNAMTDNYVWIFNTITPYTLSLSALPLVGGDVTGAGIYNSCDLVTVMAVPNAGYEFVNWTDTGVEVSTNATYEFEITENTSLVGNFAIISYDITLTADPVLGGSVDGAGSFDFGASVTVDATPNVGYSFVNWTEAGVEVSLTASYTFTISVDRALVANFALNSYDVALSSIPALGGSTTGAGAYDHGTSVTIEATPEIGYSFVNWTEAGVEVSLTASYTFTISGDRTFVANFAADGFVIALESNPVLGGSVNGAGSFDFGTSVTVDATPNVGYSFVNWTEAGVEVSLTASYTFTISGDRTLVANFALNSYDVALSSDPVLGGSTTGAGAYDHGTSVTIEATPEIGYSFVNWTENGNEISINSSYTFIITMDTTLVANFALDGYIVTLESNPLDGGNLFGADTYAPATVVTVATTSRPGFQFVNWTANGVEVSTNASFDFTITMDTTLVANYEAGQLPPVMGSSARFAILSDQAISNIPSSSITGDVGVSPGLAGSITGFVLTPDVSLEFSTTPEVNGNVYAANYAVPTPQMLIDAKADAEVAYLDAVDAARLNPVNLEGNINGLTLYPGLYESGSSYEISPGGFVYMDAMGDSNAVFVIRSSTTITTESTSEVVLSGNAQAKNIYWVAGSAMTLGTNSIMKGTLIASTSISLLTGATLEGRVLIQGAAAGQVSLDQATIVLPE